MIPHRGALWEGVPEPSVPDPAVGWPGSAGGTTDEAGAASAGGTHGAFGVSRHRHAHGAPRARSRTRGPTESAPGMGGIPRAGAGAGWELEMRPPPSGKKWGPPASGGRGSPSVSDWGPLWLRDQSPPLCAGWGVPLGGRFPVCTALGSPVWGKLGSPCTPSCTTGWPRLGGSPSPSARTWGQIHVPGATRTG